MPLGALPIETGEDVAGTLIIGYGNTLRGDDGVGCYAAEQLRKYFHSHVDVKVLAAQQLTPEMAKDISRTGFVIFVDASNQGEPGSIRHNDISLQAGPTGFTHQFTPPALLAAAEQLYGRAPEAISITMAGWSFDLSEELSPSAKLCLAELIQQVKEAVADHSDLLPSWH
jgi:hydrogenase maturation protease